MNGNIDNSPNQIKTKSKFLPILIVFIVLLIIGGGYYFFINKNNNPKPIDNKLDNTSNKPDDTSNNIEEPFESEKIDHTDLSYLPSLKLEDTSSFSNEIKMKIECRKNDFICYDSSKTIKIKTESKNAKIINVYYDIFNLYIDANKCKIYDARSNKSYVIENLPTDKFKYYIKADEVTNDLVGISYINEDNYDEDDFDEDEILGFYSLILDKDIYNNKYNNFEVFSKKYMIGVVGDYEDGTCFDACDIDLLSTDKEKIIGEDIYIAYHTDNVIYFVNKYDNDDGYLTTTYFATIYTEDLKKIADGFDSDLISIDENGYLYAFVNDKIMCWDKDGNVIRTNSDYKEVLKFIDKYFLAIKDGKLVIATMDGILATFDKWDSENMFLNYSSGWIKDNNKEGVYFVVDDFRVKKSDINAYCKEYGCSKDQKEWISEPGVSYGYEYYYIPSTGESGRITTPINGLYAFPKYVK